MDDILQFMGLVALAFVGLLLLRRHFAGRLVLATETASIGSGDRDLIAARLDRIRAGAVNALASSSDIGSPVTAPPPAEPAPSSAILFRQHIPPRVDATSYWGGLPLLPADTAWPNFTTEDGTVRALSFVLQVDCAAIPTSRLGSLLPDRGLLLLFLDLDWGTHWQWRVIHVDADPGTLRPAAPPADLPKLFDSRGIWPWMQDDRDWPTLLPRFSFDPVVVEGLDLPPPADEDEALERRFWPGTIDVEAELDRVGGIVDSRSYENRYEESLLIRPFANFPHDWRAVSIAAGHLGEQLGRGHLSRFVARGDMTQEEADAFTASARAAVAMWTDRAAAHAPHEPVPQDVSDAVWQLYLDYQKVALFGATEAVYDAVESTLAEAADPASILSGDAVDLVRHRHALGSRGKHGLHINTPDRMLGPPSCPQMEAEERVDDWLLLLEMSSNSAIGHHFGEGVYQFWIRPDDLAQRRFDRVELTAEAY